MKAMVLAAGLGTRLRPITRAIPKPMVPVLNRPVMEHIVRLLARHEMNEVIANLYWFPETIQGHFGDGSDFGVELAYSHEDALHGTAGGVRVAADYFGDSFLVISGDALTDIDLASMRKFHDSHDGIATLATKRVVDTSEFGVVITGDDGRVQGFQEKPDTAEALSDLSPTAASTCSTARSSTTSRARGRACSPIPGIRDGFADWALDVFPALMEAEVPFYSYEFDSYWNDIGTISELIQGNFDGLARDVMLEIGEPEREPGIWAGGVRRPGAGLGPGPGPDRRRLPVRGQG